jgi:hypothetical protein
MGFFSSTIGAIGNLFEEAGAAVGDVVEDIGTSILGPAGQRGERIGTAVGGYLESQGVRGATGIGRTLGGTLSADIAAAPDIAREQARQRQLATQDQIESVSDAPITEDDYRNLQRGRQIYTAGFPSAADEGTVIDIRLPKPKTGPGIVVGAGMDFLEEVGEFFFGDDNAAPMTGMQMCKPARAKAFSVNPNTGCISITRKQQAKLKELVRMVGIEQASKQIGLPVSMTSQLLLKTFRSRRRGISGADIRAVKRVDRQMHSLACALGGISQTSRAVASRKAPPKRSC